MVEAYIGGAYKLRKSAALVIGLEYSIKMNKKEKRKQKEKSTLKELLE